MRLYKDSEILGMFTFSLIFFGFTRNLSKLVTFVGFCFLYHDFKEIGYFSLVFDYFNHDLKENVYFSHDFMQILMN